MHNKELELYDRKVNRDKFDILDSFLWGWMLLLLLVIDHSVELITLIDEISYKPAEMYLI